VEQLANAITFYVFFVESKLGKTGLTVTCDIWELTQAGGATEIVTAGSASEIGDGLYKYVLSSGSVDAIGEYIAVFKTATTTVDAQHIPALWIVGRGGNENLDAAISSRNAMTPPTANAIADQVWDELAAGHVTPLTTGALLASAGAASDPLLNAVPGSYAIGTAGAALGRIGNTTIPVQSQYDPVTMTLTYLYGDDYTAAINRNDDFTTTYDLTAGTVNLRVKVGRAVVVVACSIVSSGLGGSVYRLAPTAAQIATIGVGVWHYNLEMVLASGLTITEIEGSIVINLDVR
jgi:hypothetical protein